MIEQGFNHSNATIKEGTVFFETRKKNVEPKEDKKSVFLPPRKKRIKKTTKRRKEITPI